ncbi:MAG: AraC family transcriptional regulator [Chloroflexota bacterium]
MEQSNALTLRDRLRFWHNEALDISLMQALYVKHKYPPHSHDYYVICLLEAGLSTYQVCGQRYLSPPRGIICINPGDLHTGEAASDQGLQVRALYPTVAHLRKAAAALTERPVASLRFKSVYIQDPTLLKMLFSLHEMLRGDGGQLAQESAFVEALTLLLECYTDVGPAVEIRNQTEHDAVQKGMRYLEERYMSRVSLTELADHVGLSTYYYLRIFRKEVGLPPYTYLQNFRIRQAQALIKGGMPLVEVSAEVGLSNQSHLTRLFKRYLGVTPGQYASQIRR